MKGKNNETNDKTAAKTFWKNAILLAITALALSASRGSRGAEDCVCLAYWDNSGAGDWFVASNWGPSHNQVPECGPSCSAQGWEADINNGGTAQISSTPPPGNASAWEVFLGKDSGKSGKLSVVGPGTLDQCNAMWVGWDGTGRLSITNGGSNGGSVSTDGAAGIAAQTGSNGTATVDGTNSTWTVNGATLYVGGTINGGGGTGLLTVTNSGTVTASSVYVYGSGTLAGNGRVGTTNGVTVAGTLEPTGTPPNATLTLSISGTGGLTLDPGSTTLCNVVPSGADNIDVVSGGATIQDSGKLIVTMTGTFTQGTTYTLLHADTVLNGTFRYVSITYPTGQCFTPIIQYDANNVKLYLQSCN